VKEIGARLSSTARRGGCSSQALDAIGRGRVQGDVGFQVEPVELPAFGFTSLDVGVIEQHVSAFRGPGVDRGRVHLKPHLTLSLARYHPIVPFYAYEIAVRAALRVLFRPGSQCQGIDRLDGENKTWDLCRACSLGDLRLLRSPSIVHELLSARAWSLAHRQDDNPGLAAASTVIVYNEEARRRCCLQQDTASFRPA